MNRITNSIAIVAAVILMDGHWFVMQTVSWVEMATAGGNTTDVSDILTGKAVCDHCKAIKSGQKSDESPIFDFLSQVRLLSPVLISEPELPPRAVQSAVWLEGNFSLADQTDPCVLVQPPRA